jgi:hypothetical protein
MAAWQRGHAAIPHLNLARDGRGAATSLADAEPFRILLAPCQRGALAGDLEPEVVAMSRRHLADHEAARSATGEADEHRGGILRLDVHHLAGPALGFEGRAMLGRPHAVTYEGVEVGKHLVHPQAGDELVIWRVNLESPRPTRRRRTGHRSTHRFGAAAQTSKIIVLQWVCR